MLSRQNATQPKLVVLSPVDPRQSYSGLKYLCDALVDRGIDIELWTSTPWYYRKEIQNWRFPVRYGWHTFVPRRFHRFRLLAARLHALCLALLSSSPILFVELAYIREMALLKRLRPRKRLIHYCPELFSIETEPNHAQAISSYARFADVPELIIDVEPNRAKLRHEWYRLSKQPLVILNTVPLSEVPAPEPPGALSRLAGVILPDEIPILLYIGGVDTDREMATLVEALERMECRPYLLAFCHGDQNAISEFRRQCEQRLGPHMCTIRNSVPRRELLACMHEADVGYVYYRPSRSINNMYAAPSKLFEYMAVGLPVIASNNPSLTPIIERYGLGVCVEDESVEALSKAIESLIFDSERIKAIRHRAQDIFKKHFCYEVVAKDAVEVIYRLITRES